MSTSEIITSIYNLKGQIVEYKNSGNDHDLPEIEQELALLESLYAEKLHNAPSFAQLSS